MGVPRIRIDPPDGLGRDREDRSDRRPAPPLGGRPRVERWLACWAAGDTGP